MGPTLKPCGVQNPGAHDEGCRQLLKLFHDSHTTATAGRTEGRLLDVPLWGGSWATFSKISLFPLLLSQMRGLPGGYLPSPPVT